ncbi:hypothetical protein AVEN_187526-1 [Araneus ventricosus]|uniref:Uncharacterized protein n=1 Tax=Araneus ventricosus TaxID=182803 RepID=A0A4Y2BS36_ARAVE|nr:hypothetical protein AVEN_187526-1 [Araneus ventricosus]
MQKEEYEEWMSIFEDIPAAVTDLEIYQAVCDQYQAIKVDDSDGDEYGENPPTNAEVRQALDILKSGVQHRSTKTIRVRTIYK